MFRNVNGSTQTVILIVLTVLIVGASIYYLTIREGGSRIMRSYLCNVCDKNFEVDLNKARASKPACPYCSASDVKMLKKP